MEYDFCPNCNADLTQGNLMFVEHGCTNYIYYKKSPRLGWVIDDENDGQNPTETEYACRQCEFTLPTNYQEYYEENL